MKLYDFTRLISKYSVSFLLRHTSKGKYVSGKWVPGEEIIEEMQGAIVPISDRKVYDSGGTYTTMDRELYILQPLPDPLSEYYVIYKENVYAVETGRNFSDYADAMIYTLKYQSKKENKDG